MNKPTTLREFDKWKDETMTDFVANFRYPIISPEYISMFEQFIVGHAKRLLTSHNTELLRKIEGLESAGKNINVVWRHDVISLINQNK